MLRLALLAPIALAAACGGAGPYGFARTYEPLGDEEDFMKRTRRVSYQEVQRDPAAFQGVLLGWFGVVDEVRVLDEESGEALVLMQYRTHRARHLCADERDSSCRVTVTDASSGPFAAHLYLSRDEREGEERVWVGSMLKVYGEPTGDFDARGGPILETVHHRHWPHGTYTTTAAAGTMRR